MSDNNNNDNSAEFVPKRTKTDTDLVLPFLESGLSGCRDVMNYIFQYLESYPNLRLVCKLFKSMYEDVTQTRPWGQKVAYFAGAIAVSMVEIGKFSGFFVKNSGCMYIIRKSSCGNYIASFVKPDGKDLSVTDITVSKKSLRKADLELRYPSDPFIYGGRLTPSSGRKITLFNMIRKTSTFCGAKQSSFYNSNEVPIPEFPDQQTFVGGTSHDEIVVELATKLKEESIRQSDRDVLDTLEQMVSEDPYRFAFLMQRLAPSQSKIFNVTFKETF